MPTSRGMLRPDIALVLHNAAISACAAANCVQQPCRFAQELARVLYELSTMAVRLAWRAPKLGLQRRNTRLQPAHLRR